MSSARQAIFVECVTCRYATQLRKREDGTFKACGKCGGVMAVPGRRWEKFAERAKKDLQSMGGSSITAKDHAL